MPLVFITKLIGRILAILPEWFNAFLAGSIGRLLYHLPTKRSRDLRSNLHHAFPEKEEAWRVRVGKATSGRLVEMAFFALASPFFSRRWFESHLTLAEDVPERLRQTAANGGVVLIPHVTLAEMVSAVPAVVPETKGGGAVYRPLKQASLDRWVKESRERWGIDMVSRRDGISGLMRKLRDGGSLAVLFDQNTGKRGCLFYFLGRLASGTHLPGLLARKFDVPVSIAIPRRTGFWRATMQFDPLPQPKDPVDLILTGHQALENYLRGSESQAADWLWYHNRWGTHDSPRNRFFIRANDNYLERSRLFQELEETTKKTRLWFRMPNWLGDVVMALPLIRAVRRGRPDAEITLLALPALRPLLERAEVADRLIDLPSKGEGPWRYFRAFVGLRKEYPDGYLCLTNSTRGDLESWLTGCQLRLGMLRSGKRRPLLSDAWKMPEDIDESQCHQLDVWEAMFRGYGLREPLVKTPLNPDHGGEIGVGLICGTENTPEKRWPVNHWRGLIEKFLEDTEETLYLYGTARDREITDEVASGLDPGRVKNLAGETNLEDFLERLSGNRAVICNDTGGMHLANLIGVPVLAIFGPTNPVRTGPVFEAPVHLLQPPGCPPTGGQHRWGFGQSGLGRLEESMSMSELVEITVIEAGDAFSSDEEMTIRFEESLRQLPGRRQVYRATLADGTPALCKRYAHPKKSQRDAAEEWTWLNRLIRAQLPVPPALGLARNDSGEWFVLTRWIDRSRELGDCLMECAAGETLSRMGELIALVHAVHEAGFLQEDLHLGNFLLGSDGKLWLIDAASHRHFERGMPNRVRILNWALLRANLRVAQRPVFDDAFEASAASASFLEVVAATPRVLKKRLRRYRAKCQRTCTEFVLTETDGVTLVRRRNFAPDWLGDLVSMDPERLAAEHRVLKRASKCLVVQGEAEEGSAWVLKSHWHSGWSQTGRTSRARRSWIAGNALRLLGIATPEPFAFWECRVGGRLVRNGFLMAVDDGAPLQEWVREEHASKLRQRVAEGVGSFFGILSELHASHGDTKASNFHVGEQGDIRVIDLDSFRWGGGRWRSRLKKDRERFTRNAIKFPAGAEVFTLGTPKS